MVFMKSLTCFYVPNTRCERIDKHTTRFINTISNENLDSFIHVKLTKLLENETEAFSKFTAENEPTLEGSL